MGPARLMIATPCHRGQVHIRHATSLFHTARLAHEAGCDVDYATLSSTHLAFARNLFVAEPVDLDQRLGRVGHPTRVGPAPGT